ncbi:MAG: cytochrome C, partial [Betaproteobacteria bacterium]|nr:cytochrome C [Betaproteobacteria bacterium]
MQEGIMFGSVISFGFVLVSITIMLASGEVNALPSFARQTGMSCSACHVQAFGPGLTPTGRNFKLYGYTDVSEDRTGFIPIAGMIRGSFTHTSSGQPGGAADRFGPNNNATIDEASIFYAGRITSKIGAFVQGTYDGVSNTGALDNTDIRLADYADLAGSRLVYGISVNNNPTVQDLWNTTPAWGFPWSSSPLAPTPAAGLFIESLGAQVVGATIYTMWNNLLYIEGGAYTSLPRNVQQGIGTFNVGQNRIDGGAPYWRVALQRNWHGHYGAIGSFGMRANANPQRMQGAGTDQYTDFGFDATYQYLVNPRHIFELNATYVREHRDLNASAALGFAEKKHGSLDVVRVRTGYT